MKPRKTDVEQIEAEITEAAKNNKIFLIFFSSSKEELPIIKGRSSTGSLIFKSWIPNWKSTVLSRPNKWII